MRAGFAQVAIDIEHERNSAGVDLSGLEERHIVVHLVRDLCL